MPFSLVAVWVIVLVLAALAHGFSEGGLDE